MKLDKRGQVLVSFIIMMPIILLLLVIVIDLGLFGVEKRTVDDNVKTAVRYGVKNIKDENIENKILALLIKNIENINDNNIDIDVYNNYVKVGVNKKYNPLFNISNNLEINATYYGSINDSKIEIKKE